MIFFLTACSYSLKNKDKAEEMLSAHSSVVTKNHTIARMKFTNALSSVRRDIRAEAYYEIAKLDREKGDYKSYIKNIENASIIDPDKYELKLANAYYKYGSNEQKIRAKNLFIKHQETDENANFILAKIIGDVNEENYFYRGRHLLMSNIEKDLMGKKALQLARTYHAYDNDIIRDFKQAEYWYRQSISKGNADAAYELAVMWKKHNLRDNADIDALSLILKSANSNQQKSIKYAARNFAKNNETSHAVYWYQTLADKYNEREAYDYLAMAYLKNAQQNSEKFPKKSMENYKNAQRHGSDKGDLVLAIWDEQSELISGLSDERIREEYIHLKGLFGGRQPHLEQNLYTYLLNHNIDTSKVIKSDKHDNILQSAQSLMARIDDKKNIQKAFVMYKKAADLGIVEGQFQTGLMYARGIGVQKNMDMAKFWLEKAEKNGYPFALETLESLK